MSKIPIEPLRAAAAKKLIREILGNGTYVLTRHAEIELAKDDLDVMDCVNVLRGGIVEEAEYENGEWRYRVRTPRMCVVIAFMSNTKLKVITGWRFRR